MNTLAFTRPGFPGINMCCVINTDDMVLFLKLCLASNRTHFPFNNTDPLLTFINRDWGCLRKPAHVPK